MNRQEYRNVAGVAYVQSLIRNLKENHSVHMPHPCEIDGMAGQNTINNLDYLVSKYLDMTPPNTLVYSYDRGMDTLQSWYATFHHNANWDEKEYFPILERDGNWGDKTKEAFDCIFQIINNKLTPEIISPVPPTKPPFIKDEPMVKVVTATSERYGHNEMVLVNRALRATPGYQAVDIETIAPYYLVIMAYTREFNLPVGCLVARRDVGTDQVSKLHQEELLIKGISTADGLLTDSVVAKMLVEKLVEVIKLSPCRLIHYRRQVGDDVGRDIQNFLVQTGHFRHIDDCVAVY